MKKKKKYSRKQSQNVNVSSYYEVLVDSGHREKYTRNCMKHISTDKKQNNTAFVWIIEYNIVSVSYSNNNVYSNFIMIPMGISNTS